MLVAIGDIHGCLDPLKALITTFETRYGRYCSSVEYLFIGDYIDRGPCVRETLDYLMNLKAKKTFLMGNHEDMLLLYYKGSRIFDDIGNAWVALNNGGFETIRDLDPACKILGEMWEEIRGGNNSYKFKRNNGEFTLEKKYQDFFASLKFAEVRELHVGGNHCKLLFSHSVPDSRIPLKEVLECQSFEEFHAIADKYKVTTDETNLWNRDYLIAPIEGYTLVHGHTPTFMTEKYIQRERKVYDKKDYIDFPNYVNSALESVIFDPKKRAPDGVFFSVSKDSEKILQIDIDTAAVYGKRLSALAFPETDEDLKMMTSQRILMNPIYVDLAKGFNDKWCSYESTNLSFEQLCHEAT